MELAGFMPRACALVLDVIIAAKSDFGARIYVWRWVRRCHYCRHIDADCVSFADAADKLEGHTGQKNHRAANREGRNI